MAELLKSWRELTQAARLGRFSQIEIQVIQIEAERPADSEPRPIEDPRLEALRAFTGTIIRRMGYVEEEDIAALTAAGYTQAHAMEVILHLATKFLSNGISHFTQEDNERAAI